MAVALPFDKTSDQTIRIVMDKARRNAASAEMSGCAGTPSPD
jgi:hypothetical protein